MQTLSRQEFIPENPETKVEYPNGSVVYLEMKDGRVVATGFEPNNSFPAFRATFRNVETCYKHVQTWQAKLDQKETK